MQDLLSATLRLMQNTDRYECCHLHVCCKYPWTVLNNRVRIGLGSVVLDCRVKQFNLLFLLIKISRYELIRVIFSIEIQPVCAPEECQPVNGSEPPPKSCHAPSSKRGHRWYKPATSTLFHPGQGESSAAPLRLGQLSGCFDLPQQCKATKGGAEDLTLDMQPLEGWLHLFPCTFQKLCLWQYKVTVVLSAWDLYYTFCNQAPVWPSI